MTQPVQYEQLRGRFWGLNLNAADLPDWPACRQILIDNQPRVNLVMNGPARAEEIAGLLPNSIVSNRFYHRDDTKYWLNRKDNPQAAVDDMIAMGAIQKANVWNEIDCEPQVAGWTNEWVDWTIKVADRMGARGYHYVTAVAVGKTFFRNSMNSDAWNRFIEALHTNPFLHLGVHEYGYIFPMAQWMSNYPYNMFDGVQMHPDKWPTSIPRQRNADGTLPHNWHLGRTEWLQIRSEELGYGRIPYIITEAMHDNMDDVSRFNYVGVTNGQPLKEWVKQFNGGDDVSGINSLHGLYRQVLPEFTPAQLFYKQLEWADKMYGPECIGGALFTWSGARDWRRFAVQDERLRGTFQLTKNLRIREGIGTMTVPPKVETPTELTRFMINTTVDWRDLRVRAQPTLSGSVVGNVPDGPIEAYCYVPSPAIERDGYSWVYVSFETGTGAFEYTNGWSAAKRLSTGETCLELKPHPKETGEVPAVDLPEEPEQPTVPDDPTQEPPTDEPTDETPTEPDKPIYGPVVVVTDLDSINDEIRSNLARFAAANVIALLDLSVHHISAVDIIEFAKKTAKERGDAILAAQDKASSPETVTL